MIPPWRGESTDRGAGRGVTWGGHLARAAKPRAALACENAWETGPRGAAPRVQDGTHPLTTPEVPVLRLSLLALLAPAVPAADPPAKVRDTLTAKHFPM